jgi:uncharacterized membrane protein
MSSANSQTSSTNEARRDLWGPVLCGAAMATVGTSVVASKLIGSQVEPFAATALRHVLALPVLALLCWLFRPAWPRPSRRDALILLLQAASGSVGYTVLLIAGTSMASAADAGVVAGTLPAMAALFAILVLGERPGLLALMGIALATAGVLLLSAGGGSQYRVPLPHRTLGIALGAAPTAHAHRTARDGDADVRRRLAAFAAGGWRGLGHGFVSGECRWNWPVDCAGRHRLVRMGAHRHRLLALVRRCASRYGHPGCGVDRLAACGRCRRRRSGARRRSDRLSAGSAGVGAGRRAHRLYHRAHASVVSRPALYGLRKSGFEALSMRLLVVQPGSRWNASSSHCSAAATVADASS